MSGPGMVYSDFLREVDALVFQACGLHLDDLDDTCLRDAFDDYVPAEEAAADVLERAGWCA